MAAAFEILVLVLALGVSAVVWSRTRGVWCRRLLISTAPLSVGLLGLLLVTWIAFSARLDWNSAKLAPVVAMTKGYSLYQSPTDGVMTAWIYGPVPAILLLPSAIASTPSNAIFIGVTINLLVALAPMLWLLLKIAGPGQRSTAVLAFTVLGLLAINEESIRRALTIAGPDAFVIGFTAASCALFLSELTPVRMLAIAFCVVLACWSKQSALPVAIVAPLWIVRFEGRKAAVRYLFTLLLVAAVVSVALIALFGGSNMWFHLVTLPGAHGWRDPDVSRFAVMRGAVMLLFYECSPTLALALIAVTLLRGFGAAVPRTCSLCVWIAIAFLPAALLGYVKVGGHVNNFALVHAFLMLGACAALIQFVRATSDEAALAFQGFGLMAVSTLLLLLSLRLILPPGNVPKIHQQLSTAYDNPQEIAFAFAKAHPGVAWFPWNPLSSLLAENHLYHLEWGIVDRREAKVEITASQFGKHLPVKGQIIAFPPHPQSMKSAAEVPAFSQAVSVPDLPGFTALTSAANAKRAATTSPAQGR